MLIVGSNDSSDWGLKPESETLEMATVAVDVEEGEISDTASAEKVCDGRNKHKKGDKVVKEAAAGPLTAGNAKRMWTMRDLYNYEMAGRGYVAGLYNLAWAQAVQNKPLDDLLVDVFEPSVGGGNAEQQENTKELSLASSSSTSLVGDSNLDEGNNGLDKEEGELEEGEIDLDSAGGLVGIVVDDEDQDNSRIEQIRGALRDVHVTELEKSFETVCGNLQNALEALRGVAHQNSASLFYDLMRKMMVALRTVNSVFKSMNYKLKQHNKECFSRVISVVNSLYPTHLSEDELKELEIMVAAANASEALPSTLADIDRNFLITTDRNDSSCGKPSTLEPVGKTNPSLSIDVSNNKIGFRSRVGLLPLLDLHKDHDMDSLPSPTRETAPSLPSFQRTKGIGDEVSSSRSAPLKVDSVEPRMHYETDAVKAVSSYQQRFGRNSFFTFDRLPSPTPSNDSGDQNENDAGEETSSGILGGNLVSRASSTLVTSSDVSSTQIPAVSASKAGTNIAVTTSGSSVTAKPLSKSRDPRLRFLNSDANPLSQKQSTATSMSNLSKVEPFGGSINDEMSKWTDAATLDGPLLKRQRNMPQASVNDKNAAKGSGGWLDDIDGNGTRPWNGNALMKNSTSEQGRIDRNTTSANVSTIANVGETEQFRASVSCSKPGNLQTPVLGSSVASLPEILKSIVNPTLLMNILQLSKSAPENMNHRDLGKTATPVINSNLVPGTSASASTSFAQPGILAQPVGAQQSMQQATTVDAGKIRMKPRDPRRALPNALGRAGGEDADHLMSNVSPLFHLVSNDNKMVNKQETQADLMPKSIQPCILPDITSSFTNSLKNIANIVSDSQGSSSQLPLVSQTTHQSVLVSASRGDVNVTGATPEKKSGTVSSSALAVAASRQQNGWADVEHLFNGYDDKQKAAIQRERARRMEEQRDMFASRKLCLVLDLDHTLLNSAKFAEVDPVHEEILRKKEDQDREKSHRHLFRFPHLGMWTKLRPGIWNFLEKASKLYELHLYTMGNKLYATEMAKVLDPKGVLFSGRVISRGDDGESFDSDERIPKSKDLEGVLGMESAVVIIDDSVRVWPHNKLNLIVVERYIYFPCSRRQFGLTGPSLLEIDHDERPEDGTLACSLAVIERIHQNFYNHHSLEEADVRNILASEQRKILAGCRIVFSRIIPVGEANPQLHPLWQTAEQFGAICTNQIDDQVTHVVALSFGTDKVNWAFSRGKHIVHPGWVEASALLYRRANEQDFMIKP